MPQNLKLPICPRCNETKEIISYDYNDTKMSFHIGPAFHCKLCNISWKYDKGIMEGKPCFPCCSSAAYATANSIDMLKRKPYYGWTEKSVGILDCRRLFILPLEDFSDEEIKSVEEAIKEHNDGL